jgi:RNA polymerase sigma-70 factor (ECF subfamily)
VLADPHDHHERVDVRLDIRAALELLPEGQRMALILVDMHGLRVAEAASILNVAEGTIKSRCARGRAALVPLLGLAPPSEGPEADPSDGTNGLSLTSYPRGSNHVRDPPDGPDNRPTH